MSDTALVEKFQDPKITANGDVRARVAYNRTKTLWFNTGTLCNIECVNCYIESSPTNDRLVYLTVADVAPYLDELDAAGEAEIEIGFTGGEPFMAPEMIDILRLVLERGHSVLMLTNAMQPMMRPRVKGGLMALRETYGDRLTMRVSLDHFSPELHDKERGAGSFELAMKGLRWLSENEFSLALAGRTIWGEEEEIARKGYAALIATEHLKIDPDNTTELVLFPEMRPDGDPPEITTACWGILDKDPNELMCASQRMVVKRKGAKSPTVVACTLLPYDKQFELGETLQEARKSVPLNHSYCASFCVLGGGSCSA
ncbi:MAG: radical SAM protein [Henriciella sp.]|nr:radical SAM protein [Henriciella sp.]